MFDLVTLIKAAGYFGIVAIVFAETGLFIGFFLPGDSLLFTAGFLASQGFLDITVLVVTVCIAAIAGDSVGYAIGYRVGPKIFSREDSLLFHRSNLDRTRVFFEKHGGKTIILARFLPVVRTFAPVLAGVGRMRYRSFLSFNIIGGIVWGAGMALLGFTLGRVVPGVDRYLIPIIVLIIVLSILPSLYHVLRDPSFRAQLRKAYDRRFRAASTSSSEEKKGPSQTL